MATHPNRRVIPAVLKADQDALTALQTLGDYHPANAAFDKPVLAAKSTALAAAQTALVNAQNALDAARDALVAAEWEFHNALLGAKRQVVAQYGDDSDQAQAMGLKKKSERKRWTPRQKKEG
jgi:hypothetical protein